MEKGSVGTLESALASPFFSASPDGLVVVDETGRIVACNPQVEEFLGYAPDELAGRPIEELVPPTLRTVHESHRTSYFEEPRVRSMGAGLHLRALRKDGKEAQSRAIRVLSSLLGEPVAVEGPMVAMTLV